SVLHQSGESQFPFLVDQNLISLVEEGSREKFSRLLISLRGQDRISTWELFLRSESDASQVSAVYLAGVNHEGRVLIYGGGVPDCIPAAEDWLRVHPDTLPAGMLSMFDQNSSGITPEANDNETFDEMTRLYGELSAMQRELAKKQVQLEQLNATISRYATSLEDMVAERTQQLQESEARFRGIFEFSSLGIAILDEQGNLLSANQSLSSILNRISFEEETTNIAAALFQPAGLDFQLLYQQLNQGDLTQVRFETDLDCQDGSKCWVEINFFLVPLEGGAPPIAINLVEDITARKDSEQALIQAEKLTTVGKIAASLAHEINNPLQAIMGNIDLASESLDKDDPSQRRLLVARDELQRVSRIVSELRSAGRKPVQRKKSLSPVEEVVDTIASLVRKKCEEKGVGFSVKAGKSLPLVWMDSEQIEQVLLNLVVNAIEATPSKGKISIETRYRKKPSGIDILVCNNGDPIPESVVNRIFEPFFTTKEEGLGLGLHISRQIMDAHNGTIELVGEQKQTCFRVFLPEPVK
ncbi:MAG: PAS domain S-box protein, partial [Chloroflexi bacterium]|nr:PAS domain S-box protein [Chloroflexota bacterium]